MHAKMAPARRLEKGQATDSHTGTLMARHSRAMAQQWGTIMPQALERSVRGYVAMGSGLDTNRVIPGNSKGPAPNGPVCHPTVDRTSTPQLSNPAHP